MRASDIMTKDVITVRPEQTVEEVAKLLVDNKISGVPVIEDDKVIGMVTEADLIMKAQKLKAPSYIQLLGGIIYLDSFKEFEEELKKYVAVEVSDIMTENVITVNADVEIDEIASIMTEEAVNRLPVLKDGKLAGIISRADIVKAFAQKGS